MMIGELRTWSYVQLSSVVTVIISLPMTVSDPSIPLPLYYASPPPTTSTPSIFNIPLTEQSMEFAFYNASKGVNITIPANYSRHSLPSGALTRVNIGIISNIA